MLLIRGTSERVGQLNTGGLIFCKDSECYFSKARNRTNDNFSVFGDTFSIPYFFSAQHFDTRPSNEGDEHINATRGGRQPYTADTGSFQIEHLLDNCGKLVKIQGGKVNNNQFLQRLVEQ